jgi:hypothetical protein
MEATMTETMVTETGLVVHEGQVVDVSLTPVMDVARASARLHELHAFTAGYLTESKDGGTDGGDYGVIPGAGKKKVLLKSGADKLCDIYGLADEYQILSKIEDYDRLLFDYTLVCRLTRKADGMFVGSGLGSCSSWESKYRWREAQRTCPTCGVAAIIKGKAEFGGGWLCWAKKGGCGAKYADKDIAIIGQDTGRVENPDLADTKNTVLKMAKKRAKIDAVIGVTRSSGLFAQEYEEGEVVATQGAPAGVTASVPKSVPTATVTAPVVSEPVAGETHAEKIARIKAAAGRAKPANEPVAPAPVTIPVAGSGDAALAYVTGFNVRNGPVVMKDGEAKPTWGPLFVVTFSTKVKASDGSMVIDATTFDQALAEKAEALVGSETAVHPLIEPSKKKGSFRLVGLE